MSNMIPANVNVPAHLASRMGTQSSLSTSIVGGLGGSSVPRISIKGSRFRIVEGDTETVLDSVYLDVCIVGANPRLSKTWYATQWDPNTDVSGPDCFSLDGVAPDPEVTDRQNDLCASCPQNAWGSKITPNGQQVKACADNKRLAIVAADDPTGPVYLLSVTPAALKGLNQYQKELMVRGIPPEVVVTRVTFDTDASFPKLKFGFSRFNSEDTQSAVDELFGSPGVLEITGEVIREQPVEPVREAPVRPAKKAAPAPAPEPEVEDEPAPAPAPKRGFGAAKKAAPAPKQEVVDEVDEAEDEPAPAPKRGFGAAKKAAPASAKKPVDTEAANALADEIAALIGEVGDDD